MLQLLATFITDHQMEALERATNLGELDFQAQKWTRASQMAGTERQDLKNTIYDWREERKIPIFMEAALGK